MAFHDLFHSALYPGYSRLHSEQTSGPLHGRSCATIGERYKHSTSLAYVCMYVCICVCIMYICMYVCIMCVLCMYYVCMYYVCMYYVYMYYWASEASPTLGCSIEISRDIYIYVVGMSEYVKLTAELRVAHAHAQSLFLAVKPVTPALFISYTLEL